MRISIYLLLLGALCCGTSWAASGPHVSGSQPHTVRPSFVQASAVPQMQATPYIAVGDCNLTEVWLQSPAARIYWNGVWRPTQINMVGMPFRDPALVPPLFHEKKRQPPVRRSPRVAAAVGKCCCKDAGKCPCTLPARKCECLTAGQVADKQSQKAPKDAAPVQGPVAPKAAVEPIPAAPVPPLLPGTKPAQSSVQQVTAKTAPSRPPAIPKAPTPLQ